MKGKLMLSVFWGLVLVFIALVILIFIDRLMTGAVMFPVGAIFFCLGLALIVLTVKGKLAGREKLFLLLTGASAAGLPVFAIIHNVMSGLLDVEEPVFFIMAVIVCPVAFMVGIVATLIIILKNRALPYSGQSI